MEIKDEETAEEIYAATRAVLINISDLHFKVLRDLDLARLVAVELAKRFDLSWRSWFIELGRGNLDEYVQVFQP